MPAAPLALLRAAASAGYADKVAVAFTHFDQVKGDNPSKTLVRPCTHKLEVSGAAHLMSAMAPTAAKKRTSFQVRLVPIADIRS
jgi:hypothetical protein